MIKKIFKWLSVILFIAVLFGTFVFLWNKTRPKKEVYDIETPSYETLRQSVLATGKIEPRDEVLIKPQISGIISEVLKEAGTMVKKGDVIATVKVIPEIGSLNSAESRVNLAKINLEQIQKETERTKQLYAKGVVSKEEYEQAMVNLDKANEETQNAQDNLEIVQNGIAQRYAAISNTQIRATIDGMILDVPIKVGNSVILSNTFNDGTTIATVADMSNMIFQGRVDETDIGRLTEDMPVKLTIGALPDVELDATLEYISPKATDVNGVVMFELKAAVIVPDSIFVRAGYSANADILIENHENVLTIPESCIEFENGKSYIYMLTSDESDEIQVFEKKEIEAGFSDGINIEILNGVSIGDRIRGNKQ